MEQRFTFSGYAYGPRRGGFFHEVILTDNVTGATYKGRANWCNRTWEPRAYYTAEHEAIYQAVAEIEAEAVRKAQEARKDLRLEPVRRLSKKFRLMAIKFYADHEALDALNALAN